MRRFSMMSCMVLLLASVVVNAAPPQLKGSVESAGNTGLTVKPLAASQLVPAITPKGQQWRFRRGGESWTETHFNAYDIWLLHERGAEWKDRKENRLFLAKPTAYCPVIKSGHAKREDIDSAMTEDAEMFKEPTDEVFAHWASDYTRKTVEKSDLSAMSGTFGAVVEAKRLGLPDTARAAAFFKMRDGTWYFVDILSSQEMKPKEAEALLKKFLSGVAVDKKKSASGGVTVEGRWRTIPVPGYVFKTDLAKSQAEAFVKNSGRFMGAMQNAYRRYVPPQKEMKTSTIRVFSTRAGYNEYMKDATGESGERSIGLWSPSHEELLILDMGNSERAETLKTMRHEAFHQYLFYATGRGSHAMWFNEGHACFFENVNYDAKKNAVSVWDDPTDRRPSAVASDPEKYAALIPKILPLDHSEFYSGTLSVVNDRYTAAWAVIYFLEKGVPSFPEFADYKKVMPTYLAAMAAGRDAAEATREAWETVKGRDISADFLKFWSKRKAARKYEPKMSSFKND